MEIIIACIVAAYFVIGAIAILLINRNKDKTTARNGWVKYFVYLAIVLTVLLCIGNDAASKVLFSIILLVSTVEILLVSIRSQTENYLLKIIGISIYAMLAFGFWLIRPFSESLTIIYVVVFSFDGFSQISGQLFGRKKLVSAISPQKTIAGFTGGMLMGTVTGAVLMAVSKPFVHPGYYFAFSLLICVSAFLGDLAASYFKRICGVKDYSNLIPGHGGFLDRFDSFIAAGALFYFVLTLLYILS